MIDLPLFARVVLVTVALQTVAAATIIGPARMRAATGRVVPRLRRALPYLALLGAVLAVNSQTREVAPALSWLLAIDLTGTIYGIEGAFVAWLQSFATPALTGALSFVYVYGYVFALVFPIVAYLALEDDGPLCETCLAYSYNYAFGLCLYVAFIAYGPRNLLPGTVESLMYANWPESQLLTSEINTNTNVFPSLHASLATTVALLAFRTRRHYPAWSVLSSALAFAIGVSTMYLGIHWAMDVAAGVVLGVASVWLARRRDPVRAIQVGMDGTIGRRLSSLWRRVRGTGK